MALVAAMTLAMARAVGESLARLKALIGGLDDSLVSRRIGLELATLASSVELLLLSPGRESGRPGRPAPPSRYDQVTKVYNHLTFLERLDQEFERALRHASPLSLVVASVEDLTAFSAARGRLVANELLRRVARVIRQNIRESDVAGRCEDDALGIVLPRTNHDQAEWLAQRVRKAIAALPEPPGVTLGVASLGESTFGPLELLAQAHDAVNRARTQAQAISLEN